MSMSKYTCWYQDSSANSVNKAAYLRLYFEVYLGTLSKKVIAPNFFY